MEATDVQKCAVKRPGPSTERPGPLDAAQTTGHRDRNLDPAGLWLDLPGMVGFPIRRPGRTTGPCPRLGRAYGGTMSDHVLAGVVATVAGDAPSYRVDLRSGHHRLVGDEPAGAGGGDAGPSPFGLVLAGLGACTAITLRMYAERKGWPLDGLRIELRYVVAEGRSARIERTIHLSPGLSADQRARLEEVAAKTPVTKAIGAGTPIPTTLVVEGAGS